MNVNILLNPANESWIIHKIAKNLTRELRHLDIEANISSEADKRADIVHHMSWAFANIGTPQPSTMLVTHLDDIFKLNQVRSTLSSGVSAGICTSRETMKQLLAHGCERKKLYFINLAHDGVIVPRRIVIGITTRVYPDGRKREIVLQKVARTMDLSAFEFQIFGKGWEPTIPYLETAGADVRFFGESGDYLRDYDAIVKAVPNFDYYLYLGMDEGSLGTLDALAAGVPTIVTPQGFHLDLIGGITHPVITEEDLQNVLQEISQNQRLRTNSVANLTWTSYAVRHLKLWESILNRTIAPDQQGDLMDYQPENRAVDAYRRKTLLGNSLSLRRFLSSASHWRALQPIRRLLDRHRINR